MYNHEIAGKGFKNIYTFISNAHFSKPTAWHQLHFRPKGSSSSSCPGVATYVSIVFGAGTCRDSLVGKGEDI
jgi:hypothetical protein